MTGTRLSVVVVLVWVGTAARWLLVGLRSCSTGTMLWMGYSTYRQLTFVKAQTVSTMRVGHLGGYGAFGHLIRSCRYRSRIMILIALVFLVPTVAEAQVPGKVTCSAVRAAVARFGIQRSEEFARKYLTANQIRRARLCLKRATGRRR